jgi:hypothetical protein
LQGREPFKIKHSHTTYIQDCFLWPGDYLQQDYLRNAEEKIWIPQVNNFNSLFFSDILNSWPPGL